MKDRKPRNRRLVIDLTSDIEIRLEELQQQHRANQRIIRSNTGPGADQRLRIDARRDNLRIARQIRALEEQLTS